MEKTLLNKALTNGKCRISTPESGEEQGYCLLANIYFFKNHKLIDILL